MTRPERVAGLLKKEISEIFQKKLQDPRIKFVSITQVELTPDLKEAKIFVSIMTDEEEKKKETMKGLLSASRFIRGELGRKLELRFIPQINFIRDDSLERGTRIYNLISEISSENESSSEEKR